MEEAQKQIKKEKENLKLSQAMFDYEVKMRTQRLLNQTEEFNKRAEKTKMANENREKDEVRKKRDDVVKQEEVDKKVKLKRDIINHL